MLFHEKYHSEKKSQLQFSWPRFGEKSLFSTCVLWIFVEESSGRNDFKNLVLKICLRLKLSETKRSRNLIQDLCSRSRSAPTTLASPTSSYNPSKDYTLELRRSSALQEEVQSFQLDATELRVELRSCHEELQLCRQVWLGKMVIWATKVQTYESTSQWLKELMERQTNQREKNGSVS